MMSIQKREPLPAQVLATWERRLPNVVVDLWREHGLFDSANGFIRFVDPAALTAILAQTYAHAASSVPFATTALGDVLVWRDNAIRLLKFRRGTERIIAEGDLEYFVSDLSDEAALESDFDWQPYPAAVEAYGRVSVDECFAFTPILALGGPAKVGNLKKARLPEHLFLITQLTRKLGS